MFDAYRPSVGIAVWSTLFACVRFENQRWIKARMGGLRGGNQWIGLLVDLTGGLAMLFAIFVIALNWYDFGWRNTLGLLAITTVASMAWAYLGTFVERAVGKYTMWLVATPLIYITAAVLSSKYSWFGAF